MGLGLASDGDRFPGCQSPALGDQALERLGPERQAGGGPGLGGFLGLERVPMRLGCVADTVGRAQERGRPFGLSGGGEPLQGERGRLGVTLAVGALQPRQQQPLRLGEVAARSRERAEGDLGEVGTIPAASVNCTMAVTPLGPTGCGGRCF
jgi:hypothetical protein